MKEAITLWLILCAATVLAQTNITVISNVGQSTATDFIAGDVNSDSTTLNSAIAVSFTTSDTVSYFSSASVLMANSPGGGMFTLLLCSNNGGVPGSTLVCLSGNPNPTSAGVYTYTNGSSLELSANTTYWLVATNTVSSGYYYWCGTQSTNLDTGSIWTLGGLEYNYLTYINNAIESNPGWQNWPIPTYTQFSVTVNITQLPTLSISRAILLTYQVTGFSYALQQNSNLATTNWCNVTNAVLNGVISNQTVFILPNSGGQMFYRLNPTQ